MFALVAGRAGYRLIEGEAFIVKKDSAERGGGIRHGIILWGIILPENWLRKKSTGENWVGIVSESGRKQKRGCHCAGEVNPSGIVDGSIEESR